MRKTRHWKVQNNMNKVEKKRQKEQYIVEEMIRLYCRKNHLEEERQGRQMCPVCQELSDYAKLRSHKCPFMEQKTFCANCKCIVINRKERADSSGNAFFRSKNVATIIRFLQYGI